jgi:putative sterol carrier protein
MTLTVSELMAKMPTAFLPEKAVGMDAVLQFNFSGTEAGSWYTVIKDGKCSVEKGTHTSPKMTLAADSGDFVKIFTGELDGMQAFMQGKLRLTGDLSLAMKLLTMFKLK